MAGLDPTMPSAAGGRWMPKNGPAVLYTSLTLDGAMAELGFHYGLLAPLPRSEVVISRIEVAAERSIALSFDDFDELKIDRARYGELNYTRCQAVGEVIAHLGMDAVVVPSARWPTENLVLILDNGALGLAPRLVNSEHANWRTWIERHRV